jgi:pimeloyl-ACP methyl ester carboxylesterase
VLTIDLSFDAMLPTLAATRQVIAVELQGHGHTADTEREMTLGHLADDVVALLGAIAAPTLLVVGDHDFVRLEHAVEMHELIPGSQLGVLPGTTHMGVMRRADLLVPRVETFLSSPSQEK